MEKEGGYGWCITAASFFVHLIVSGFCYSGGVFHHIFLEEYEESSFYTSWLGSLLLAMVPLGAITASVLVYSFGYRVTIICGGILAGGGFAMSYIAETLWQVQLCIGVMTGLGLGIALMPSIMILDSYFYEKRDLAASIAISGIGVGMFSFPILIYQLHLEFQWKGTALILGAICVKLVVAGAAMKPNNYTSQRSSIIHMFQCSLFQSPAFTCMLITNFVWCFGTSIIYVHLPGYSLHSGLTLEDGIILICIIGVASFSSRIMFIVFAQSTKLDHITNFLCTIGLTAILTGLFTELFEHKAGAIGYSIMFGLHTGHWSTFISGVVTDLIGEEYVAYGKGHLCLSMGLGLAAGAPIAGWVLDETDNYEIIFYLAGACLLLSSIVMMGVTLKRCYYRPTIDFTSDSDTTSTISSIKGAKMEEGDDLMVTSLMSSV